MRLGTISGQGTLSWRGKDAVSVSYSIEGTYLPNRHAIKADGEITGADQPIHEAWGRSDVTLTISDGRVLEVSVLGGDDPHTSSISVNTAIEEFISKAPARR